MDAPFFPKLTLLDGAMATALHGRGLELRELPEIWLVERPGEIEAVHRSHLAAGAELLLTATLNLCESRLAAAGLSDNIESIAETAVRVARAAGATRIAGAVGPTGQTKPGGPIVGERALREQFDRAYRALARAGVDLLWAETHYDLTEARAALASMRATHLPAAITLSFSFDEGGYSLPDGTPAALCFEALVSDGADAVGLNCVAAQPELAIQVKVLSAVCDRPLIVKPNAGPPDAIIAPDLFASVVADCARNGARLVGGCCGTTAEHLRALAAALSSTA